MVISFVSMTSLTNRMFLDGGLGKSIANRGKGKTMALVFLAMIELKKDPTLRVFSNFRINAPRCFYTPYLFLEFEKLKNVLILVDDVSNIRNIDNYSATVSNITRKLSSDMIFTGQYAKQMPPTIREQINYSIYPYYSKHNDTLRIFIKYDTGRKVRFEIKNAVKFVKKTKLYDTREKPPIILRSDAIREIAKISKRRKDIERNLELYTGDKKEREQLLKEILKHKHYQGTKNDDQNINTYIQPKEDYISNLKFLGFTNREIEDIFGINKDEPSRIKKKIAKVIFDKIKNNQALEVEVKMFALNKLIEENNLKLSLI